MNMQVRFAPDRLVQKQRGDARVDATRKSKQDFFVFNFALNPGGFLFDDGLHFPGFFHLADIGKEIIEDLIAILGMDDFGMKLDAVPRHHVVMHRRDWTRRTGSVDAPQRSQGLDLIAVRHEDAKRRRRVLKEGGFIAATLNRLTTVFPTFRFRDRLVHRMGHQLHAITNPQDGNAQIKQTNVDSGCAGFIDAVRTAA
jgi:hypothetical protein